MKEYQQVGKRVPKIDAYDKVTGRAKYVGDNLPPGTLYAKILRSPYPHAEITSIDPSSAKALEGVKAVITYKDVPKIPFTVCGHPYPYDTREDCLILSKRLRYVGDPVAAVAAETPEIAMDALSLIKVEYIELPAYFTPDAALADGAVELHEGTRNIVDQNQYEIGDVDQAMAQADIIVEDNVVTPIVTHAAIETHVSLVDIDGNGRLTVYASNQAPFILKERISHALGLPPGMVRVIKDHVGGGFGGKQEPVYEPINAVLAQVAKKPVYLELTREESLAFTRTRHSMKIHIRTGVDKNGRFLAREINIVSNNGAYSSHGHNVVYNIATQFAALYPMPNLRFKGVTVYTNIQIAGAMRGYGIPQYNFAVETHMDHIARELKMDPLVLRKQNVFKLGDTMYAPNMSITSCGIPEILKLGEEKIGWEILKKESPLYGNKRRGVGVSLFSYSQTAYPHSSEMSGARMALHEDGSATLFIGCADIGQGTDTVMLQIASEASGIPMDWIMIVTGDTDICPYDPGAYASRQTYVAGTAVKKAAKACKDDVLRRVSLDMAIDIENLDIKDGWIINKDTDKRLTSLGDFMKKVTYPVKNPAIICHEEFHYPTANMLTFGASFAHVEVEIKTGKVDVLKLITVLDAGRIINPTLAEGQLYGGTIMSIGFGTMEQILVDQKTGKVLNDNMLDYKIPTFADVPDIEAYFVETEEISSAYGNKSLGEPPNVSPASAICNAVLDAIGILVDELPLTPERVFRHIALDNAGKRSV